MEMMHLYIVFEDRFRADGCYVIAASIEKAIALFKQVTGVEPASAEQLDDEERKLVFR